MAHFLVEYRELGRAEDRARLRAEHIAYRKGLGDKMALAGSILGEDDEPLGSVAIIQADDLESAERTARGDPYVAATVFELVSVRRYRIAAMKPPA